MRVMRKQSTNKKERFDIEYGITEHRPARKRDKREAFDRGSADRLAYYIKRNPHYFNGGRTNAEAKSIIELWEAVIWQSANDLISSGDKIATLQAKKNKQKGRLRKDDAATLRSLLLDRRSAFRFLNSEDFDSICDMLSYDAGYVRDSIMNRIKKESNLYQKHRRFAMKHEGRGEGSIFTAP